MSLVTSPLSLSLSLITQEVVVNMTLYLTSTFYFNVLFGFYGISIVYTRTVAFWVILSLVHLKLQASLMSRCCNISSSLDLKTHIKFIAKKG